MRCHLSCVFFSLPLVHMNISLCVVCIYRNVYSFSFYWHFCRLSSYDICSFLSLSLSCRCLSFTLLSECMTGEKSKYIPNKEIIFIHIQRTRGPMMKHTMRFYVYVCELRAISRARERERVKKQPSSTAGSGNLFKNLSFTLALCVCCWCCCCSTAAIPFFIPYQKWNLSMGISCRHFSSSSYHTHTY